MTMGLFSVERLGRQVLALTPLRARTHSKGRQRGDTFQPKGLYLAHFRVWCLIS